jgi:hypothetical protein
MRVAVFLMRRWAGASAHGGNNLDQGSGELAPGYLRLHCYRQSAGCCGDSDGIYARTQALTDFPELGARYWASARHVRVLLYGHYRITYLVRDDGDIEILGVFHGALDITRYQL